MAGPPQSSSTEEGGKGGRGGRGVVSLPTPSRGPLQPAHPPAPRAGRVLLLAAKLGGWGSPCMGRGAGGGRRSRKTFRSLKSMRQRHLRRPWWRNIWGAGAHNPEQYQAQQQQQHHHQSSPLRGISMCPVEAESPGGAAGVFSEKESRIVLGGPQQSCVMGGGRTAFSLAPLTPPQSSRSIAPRTENCESLVLNSPWKARQQQKRFSCLPLPPPHQP